MKVDEKPVIVKQIFKQSIETVWNSITNVEQMRQWFFENIPDFQPRVGFKTQFTVTTENHVFPHVWKVTEVVPLQKLVYNWKYDGYPGVSFVIFDLIKVQNQTQLILSTKVVEDFPDNIPEFTRESCLAGWNYFIKSSLPEYLNKKS